MGELYPDEAMAALCHSIVVLYNITRRGLACVAYPCTGAMRRPECWDRHGGIDSHVFLFPPYYIINAELGSL